MMSAGQVKKRRQQIEQQARRKNAVGDGFFNERFFAKNKAAVALGHGDGSEETPVARQDGHSIFST